MKYFLAFTLLAVTCVTLSSAVVIKGTPQHYLSIYEEKILILQSLLVSECPGYTNSKRDNSNLLLDTKIEVQKLQYERMLNRLTECRQKVRAGINVRSTPAATPTTTTTTTPTTTPTTTLTTTPTITTTTSPTTTPTPTITPTPTTTPTTTPTPATTPTPTATPKNTTTTTPTPTTTPTTSPTTTPMATTTPTTTTTTTPTSQPQECLWAVNLTQSWRLEHNGADIRGGGPSADSDGYACDFRRNSLGWFRFSGAAGNRMLNTCPKSRSCGGKYPRWTDAVAPVAVGVATSARVYFVTGSCRSGSNPIQVMRCSDSMNDLIYRQTKYDLSSCGSAFCGME